MVRSDGYIIYQQRNRIIIGLPQTMETVTSTAADIHNRRTPTEQDEAVILALVKQICEGE